MPTAKRREKRGDLERNIDHIYDVLTVGRRESVLWRALYLTELESRSTCWPMEDEYAELRQMLREALTVSRR